MVIEKRIEDFPNRIEIEFSNSCNLECRFCPRKLGASEEGFMPWAVYKKIIDEAKEHHEIILQLHRRGESLLHPNFIEMLEYVKGKFKAIQLATNATLLDKEKAKIISEVVSFISFSIDLPELYIQKKGRDMYNIVRENILEFLKINKNTRTQVSMVKDKQTSEGDIQKFRELWIDKIDRVRIYEEHSVGGRYGAIRTKREKRLLCVKPFTDMVIYWDGKVARCNHDWSNLPLGNINASTISQIWHNVEYERVRREQLSLTFSEEICKYCGSWYSEEGKQKTGIIFSAVRL